MSSASASFRLILKYEINLFVVNFIMTILSLIIILAKCLSETLQHLILLFQTQDQIDRYLPKEV